MEALQFLLDFGLIDFQVIDMLGAVEHSQHLADNDALRNAQAFAPNFLQSFLHTADSGSSSPNPSANNRSISTIAISSSLPSAETSKVVPRLAASIKIIRIDLASTARSPSTRRKVTRELNWLATRTSLAAARA